MTFNINITALNTKFRGKHNYIVYYGKFIKNRDHTFSHIRNNIMSIGLCS